MKAKFFFLYLFFGIYLTLNAQKTTVNVFYTMVAPVIDGIEDDLWSAVNPVYLEKNFTGENPTVTAYWKALWNDDYIFVIVNVVDDDHYPTWESGGTDWDYDMPEIFFDINNELYDGLGNSEANSGHWGCTPGFDQTMYGFEYFFSGWGEHEVGSYQAYLLSGESYMYEFRIPISGMYDKNFVTMDASKIVNRPIGFDVTIIDQDEGITTLRQRKVWQNDGYGNPDNEAYRNMDSCGIIIFKHETQQITQMIDNPYKFLPLPVDGFRYLKFNSYYSEDDGQVNVYEIQAYKNGINVALNMPAYANSNVGSTSYAVDNDEYSRWESFRDSEGPEYHNPDYYNPNFIVVDLGQKTTTDSMLLNIEGFDSWNQTFHFLGSPDSLNWYLVGSGKDTTGIFTYNTNIEKMVTIYDTLTVYDTIPVYDRIAVTDTLIIDVTITGINPPDNINTIKVYPNPAKDKIFINTGNNHQQMADYKIKIINSTGLVIFESNVTDQLFEIDVSDFSQTGLFFIQIIDNTSQIIDIRKIILE